LRLKGVAAALFLAIILMMPVALLVSVNSVTESVIITQVENHVISEYQTSAPIEISTDLDFLTLGASGVGTRSDPYVIGNLAISATGTCIYVHDTIAFFIIYNCILESEDNEPVIQFDNVENGQVLLCEISGGASSSEASGINFLNSRDCSVSNTSIYGFWIGIRLNTASNCSITNSKISSNNRGLLFESSSYCQIVNNSIYSSRNNGLEFGLGSHNNTVYANSIGWNGIDSEIERNAVDNGEDNHFDDGVSLGNAWTDYNGTAPYDIFGSNESVDSFPELLEDTENPVIAKPLDTAIDVETSGNTLTWIASDEFPNTYSIQIDEGPVDVDRAWNGGDITVDLDSLPVGIHSYNITLYDGAGNTASDEVSVNVVSFVLGGIGTELVMIASGITVVCFLVIILLVKKMS
jgi:parallel beta-helix repeat protein